MPLQVELLGKHPTAPNMFDTWFLCNDPKPSKKLCHRSLSSKLPYNNKKLIDWLARKIIQHHYDPAKLERLKKMYTDIGFPRYAAAHRQLPLADKTQKGNATEIILIEYIESCQGNNNLFKAFKFRYNPNVDQSMKGDDALIIHIGKDRAGKDDMNVFWGEAKFRGTPDNAVLQDISNSLSKDKLPISYSFLVDELYKDTATEPIARLLEKLTVSEIKAKGNLKYTGLLLSNTRVADFVTQNFTSNNPALVFISAGIDTPAGLITAAFQKAQDLLKKPTAL